ncbi:hypothetical protein D9M70_527480 [compost metagenome]
MHVVSENGGAVVLLRGAFELPDQVVTVEDVVAEDQCGRAVANKIPANDKCLRKAIRGGLHGILNIDAPLCSITKQFLKPRCVLWGGDNQNISNIR